MNVIYKECIVIDDHEYTVFSCDYSDSIAEQIRDEVIEGDAQSIIDSITDDVVNTMPRH
jgi:hypothetical protein